MGVKDQQLGFSDWERSRVRRQTRKEKFRCEMEALLRFSALVKLMEPLLSSSWVLKEEGRPMGWRPCYGFT